MFFIFDKKIMTESEEQELLQTRGINRELLEVKNLNAVTNLAIESVKSLKNQTWVNLAFLVFGSLLTAFITNLFDDKKNEVQIELIHNQTLEINDLKKDYKNNLNEMNIQLLVLKNQLNTIKKQQKP